MSFFFGGIFSFAKRTQHPTGEVTRVSSTQTDVEVNLYTPLDVQAEPSMPLASFATEKVQSFSAMNALVNASMLLLSCLSFSLVTVFANSSNFRDGVRSTKHTKELLVPISRA